MSDTHNKEQFARFIDASGDTYWVSEDEFNDAVDLYYGHQADMYLLAYGSYDSYDSVNTSFGS